MCGISGLIFKNKSNNDDLKKKFTNFTSLIDYRGPDHHQIKTFNNILLSSHRLSIFDPSTKSNMPMTYMKNFHIVFNGSIYNYLELKNELRSYGYKFNTESDTEVLIASYVHWQNEFLHKLNGDFAICIYDERKNKIILAKDRLGVKPLYFHENNNFFCFSSEIKSFLAFNETNNCNNKILQNDCKNYSKSESKKETFLNNVYRLLPGQMLVYDNLEKKYYTNKWFDYLNQIKSKPSKKKFNESCIELKEDLEYAIKIRLRSDCKISSTLSGGIDSTIINSILNLNKFNKKNVFHLYFKDYEDGEYKFVREFDKNNEISLIDGDKNIPEPEILNKIVYISEAICGAPNISSWITYENIHKEGYKVCLEGNGGDELFGGYENQYLLESNYTKNLFDYLKFKKIYFESSGLKPENLFYQLKNFYLKKNKKYFPSNYINFLTERNNDLFLNDQSYDEDGNNKLDNKNNISNFKSNLYLNMTSFTLQNILRNVDRTASYHQIENRSPFLDYQLISKYLKIKEEFYTKGGLTKSILRNSFRDTLPEEVYYRKHKLGFTLPEFYITENYKNYFLDILHSKDFLENENLNGNLIKKVINKEKNVNFFKYWKYFNLYILEKEFKKKKNEINS